MAGLWSRGRQGAGGERRWRGKGGGGVAFWAEVVVVLEKTHAVY